MSVAYALGWHVVRRHRLGLSVLLAGMALLVVLRQIPDVAPGAIVGCSIWVLFGLLYVAAIFTQPEADITAPGSGYPAHLFVLPVRTRELVFWPMVYGAACMVLGWLVVAGLVMNRPPAVAPMLWPACMMAAILASLQALFWMPMRFPLARVGVAFLLLGGLIYFGAGNPFGFAPWAVEVAYLAVIPCAYGIAVTGVSRARRSAHSIRVPREVAISNTVRRKRPFKSASRAQVWYEWRRGAVTFPIIVAVICVVASVPLFFAGLPTIGLANRPITYNTYLGAYMPGLLFAVPFIAWILGGAVWISSARASAMAIPAFIAMRPLTSLEMAAARLNSRVVGASIAFGLMLVCVLIWLLLPAHMVNPVTLEPVTSAPLLVMLVRYEPPRELAVAGVYILLLFGITVRNIVVGQFATLSGKPAVAYAYMAAAYAGPVLALSMFALATGRGIRLEDWYYLFGAALAFKVTASGLILLRLYRQNIASAKVICSVVGAWAVVTFAVFEGIKFVSTSQGDLNRLFGYSESELHLAPVTLLLLMAAVYTPFVRLVAAPLMLDRNRRGVA